MQIQDKVFGHENFADPGYQQRRREAFIVAVNCARPGGTCFCTSMNTGPKADSGFDLALTEIIDAESKRHEFVVEAGSERGAAILAQLPQRAAQETDIEAAGAVSTRAAQSMGRTMSPDPESLLKRNLEHPRWDEVAERCLSCGNCTMVCPTCFCTTVEDTTDLTGDNAERWRHWDSCFTVDFSYIHGGSIRSSGYSRYRQWLTHKVSHWYDQFGTSGCVGCGRCITWCPVGIDITEEVRAIHEHDGEVKS
jgi:ferredoxin